MLGVRQAIIGPMTTKNPASLATTDLALIPLDKISGVDPHNPRHRQDAIADEALDASIAISGVLQPVLLRPNPKRLGFYILVAGSRRYNSSLRLEKPSIPALIRDFSSDDEIAEASLVENIQRAPLDPIDEVLAVAELLNALEDKTSAFAIQYVAQALGKKPGFVARRAQAAKLTKATIKAIRKAGSPFRGRGLEPILLLAQLGPSEQKAFLNNPSSSADPERLRAHIRRSTLDLAGAPFDLVEKTIASAPACQACPNNSRNTPGLFGEIDDTTTSSDVRAPISGTCRESACYAVKLGAWLEEVVGSARSKHGSRLALLEGEFVPGVQPKTDLKANYDNWRTKPAKKSDPGSRPAISVSGKGLGRLRWVTGLSATKGTAKPSPERTPEEDYSAKLERLTQRRNNAFAEAVREKLQNAFTGKKPRIVTPKEMGRLIAAYGVRRLTVPNYESRNIILAGDYFPMEDLIKGVLPEIDASIKPGVPGRYEEAEMILIHVLGENPLELESKIAGELPESASLSRARAAVVKSE